VQLSCLLQTYSLIINMHDELIILLPEKDFNGTEIVFSQIIKNCNNPDFKYKN
jgi:hypothetical protein